MTSHICPHLKQDGEWCDVCDEQRQDIIGQNGNDGLHYEATTNEREADALQTQVGGDHYKSMPIQPLEYIHKNGLDYMQGNVIKYITRHKSKNGRQDVEKALHYCQLILELQYGGGE